MASVTAQRAGKNAHSRKKVHRSASMAATRPRTAAGARRIPLIFRSALGGPASSVTGMPGTDSAFTPAGALSPDTQASRCDMHPAADVPHPVSACPPRGRRVKPARSSSFANQSPSRPLPALGKGKAP
jgi:hypothetical protein